MSGFVYVLKNESMPGVVKIGFTARMPSARAEELFTSGVPTPFEIESAFWFADPQEIERELHEDFEHLRVSRCREFFRMEPEEATAAIAEKLLNPVGMLVIPEWARICEASIRQFADSCGEHIYGVAPVIDRMIRAASKANYDAKGEQANECLSIT